MFIVRGVYRFPPNVGACAMAVQSSSAWTTGCYVQLLRVEMIRASRVARPSSPCSRDEAWCVYPGSVPVSRSIRIHSVTCCSPPGLRSKRSTSGFFLPSTQGPGGTERISRCCQQVPSWHCRPPQLTNISFDSEPAGRTTGTVRSSPFTTTRCVPRWGARRYPPSRRPTRRAC